jgi:hypothetical protein
VGAVVGYQGQKLFEEICQFLTKAGVDVKGLFG